MRFSRHWLWLCVTALLVGCTQMEHRSNHIDKAPLPALDSALLVQPVWSEQVGTGIGRHDIKLLLARDGSTLYTVDNVGVIFAVNQDTGAVIWSLPLKMSIAAGPSITDMVLVAGSTDGKVVAVDLKQRRVMWKSSITGEVLAAPQIADGIVYVHSMDGGLSALSLEDGRQLWRFTHTLPSLILRRSSAPVVAGDLVVTGFSNGKLMAMNRRDGTVVWMHELAQARGTTDLQRMVDISADSVVSSNVVYAADFQNNTVALSLDTGHIVWERGVPSLSGLVVAGNLLVVSSSDGEVIALDKQNGNNYWVQMELKGRRLTKPVVTDKYVVVADEDGVSHWLDKETGKLVGRYKVDPAGVEAAPIVHNNIVYILGRSGKLAALEIS